MIRRPPRSTLFPSTPLFRSPIKKPLLSAALGIAGMLTTLTAATAQVAGSTTTIGVTITETDHLALGWSVKKGILGKTVYNDAGTKIGKVQDRSEERRVGKECRSRWSTYH